MEEQRLEAYINQIDALLNCADGEEAAILQAHPDLIDAGLVRVMALVAEEMAARGDENKANRLQNLAEQLKAAISESSSTQQEKKAEADRLLERGNEQYDANEFRGALQSWEQALTLYREMGDRRGEAASLGSLGSAYHSLGQYDKAIVHHRQSLEIAREINERRGEVNSLGSLGSAYYSLGQYDEAIEYHRQSLEIARQIGNRLGEANSLGGLGSAYYCLGQYDEAIEYHRQSLEIAREIGSRYVEAASLGNLGSAYYSLERYDEAIEYHQQSLKIARQIGSRYLEAASLGNLGSAYHSLGRYDEAIMYQRPSLEIAREIGSRYVETVSQGSLGKAYHSLGRYDEAIEYHRQSLEIAREIKDRLGEAASQGSLGKAYHSLGRYDEAIVHHRQSLEITREIGNRRMEMASLGNLGNAYHALGRYDEAIEDHRQSLEIARQIGDRRGEANSQGSLGSAYYSLGQYDKAIEYHRQSLEIARQIENRRGEAASLGNLGNAYHSLGRYDEAIEHHRQSLKIARQMGNRRGEAASLGSLGNAYYSLGQYSEAIEYHRQSLEIGRRIGNRRGEVYSLNSMGNAYRKLQQIPEAIQAYQSALAICTPTGFPVETIFVGRNLGNTAFDAQQWEEAISTYEKAIEAVEQRCAWEPSHARKRKLLQGDIDIYENMVYCYINTGNLPKAIEIVERCKSSNSVQTLANAGMYPKDAPPEICQQLQRLRQEASVLQLRLEEIDGSASEFNRQNPNYTEQLRQQWVQNRQQLDALLNQINKDIDPTFQLTQRVNPITFEEILALLEEGTALVEWYITAECFYAFTVTPGNPPLTQVWESDSADFNALSELRDKYLAAYRDPNTQWQTALNSFLDELARILHISEILAPIRHCRQLVLIPYGELHLFPLHALPIEGKTRPLDIFPGGVRYAPSCQLWQIAQRNSAQNLNQAEANLFAIQNPTGDLPFANIEVEAIRAYLQPAHILPQESATKDALNKEPTATLFRSARHIHLACKATFNVTEPMLSSLILAGAVGEAASNSDAAETQVTLPQNFPADSESTRYIPWREGKQIDLYQSYTLGEILALNLSQCRLVTLSACEIDLTGLDSPFMGLPAGFLYAGAKSAVCSLWRASDLSTALLMGKFYEVLGSEPSVAKALNRAQIWLRDVSAGKLREWIDGLKLEAKLKQVLKDELELYNSESTPFSSPYNWAAFCAIAK